MTEHSFDSLWAMIAAVDPDERRDCVFRCGHDQFASLRTLSDSVGQPLVQYPFQKGEPYRMFGYPVEVGDPHGALEFGARAS